MAYTETRAQASEIAHPDQASHPQDDLFSKSIQMYGRVIGWFVKRYEFGLRVQTHEVYF